MIKAPNPDAYKFLDDFRGKDFQGEWPTIPEMFTISAKRYPSNKCFLSFYPEEESYTYAEAQRKIHEVKDYLLSEGVQAGEKIAVSGKNSPEWAIAYFAVLYAGCIVVPLDITYGDHDMETLLAFAGVKRIFIDSNRLEGLDSDGRVGLVAKYSLEAEGRGDHPFVLDMKADKEYVAPKANSQDVAAILFTSGTTGTPKGVMLTHDNLISDCYIAQLFMHVYPTDVFYAILPLHHAYTMLAVLYETISTGASCVFGKRLVVPIMLKELKNGKVTMFLAVPLLFNKLMSALMDGVRKKGALTSAFVSVMMSFCGFMKKTFRINLGKKVFSKMLLSKVSLENIRVCICGGGPLPASTFKKYNQLGIDFVQGYGLTETSPITHLNPIEAYREDSIGHSLPFVETKVIDKDGDGNGTLLIKGPMVMKGYYNNPEATKEVLDDEGYLNTGDVGHEENGYFILTGRSKNIIVTEGGKNVFPEEIEDHFQLHYDIDQICIAGYIKDERTKSEGIAAIVYPSQDCIKKHADDIEKHIGSIIEEVNKELQSYKKITKLIIAAEPLDMTSTKKVKRFSVREKYKKELNLR